MRATVERPTVKHVDSYNHKREIMKRQMDIDSPNLGFIIPNVHEYNLSVLCINIVIIF